MTTRNRNSATYNRIQRMYRKLGGLGRSTSFSQRRMREFYAAFLQLLNYTDLDHPYAVDLTRIEKWCLERGRYDEDLTALQAEEIAVTTLLAMAHETWRQHERAIKARDWDAVDYTFCQYEDIKSRVSGEVYGHAERAVGRIRERRQDGKQGGRKRKHDLNAICHDYDEGIAQDISRDKVVARLKRKYDTSKAYINIILRKEGRAPSRNT